MWHFLTLLPLVQLLLWVAGKGWGGGARRQKEGETEDIRMRAGECAYHQLAARGEVTSPASQPIIRQSKQSASSNTYWPARRQLTEMSRGDKLRTLAAVGR